MAFLVTVLGFQASVTDFEGNLAGVAAIDQGIIPYQTLGALADEVPGLDIPDNLRGQWVVHSPLSLAGARAMTLVFGEHALAVTRAVVVMGVLAGAAFLAEFGYRSGRWAVWACLLGAVLLSVGVALEIHYMQGQVVLAALLGASLWANRSSRSGLSLALLGLAVAWRPWCAPVALFLPRSDRPLADSAKVGLIAVGLTFAALPFVGGLTSLWEWLSTALPENLALYQNFPLNQSLIAPLWPVGGLITVTVLVALVVKVRPGLPADLRPTLGAISILGFLPLVWHHYWVGLLPAFLTRKAATPLLSSLTLAFLMMGHLLVSWSPFLDRNGGRLGLVLVIGGLIWSIRSLAQAKHFAAPAQGMQAGLHVR